VGNYAIIPSAKLDELRYYLCHGALGVTPAPLALRRTAPARFMAARRTSVAPNSAARPKNGETVGSVNLASTGAAATAGVTGSPYVINGSAASGGTFNAGNYSISYVNGALGVTPAPLGIAATARRRCTVMRTLPSARPTRLPERGECCGAERYAGVEHLGDSDLQRRQLRDHPVRPEFDELRHYLCQWRSGCDPRAAGIAATAPARSMAARRASVVPSSAAPA